MGLYFAYKLSRRDFLHWIPLEGALSVAESVLERFLVKVLVDYTGVIQFRAAGEMGGMAWTGAMVSRGRNALVYFSVKLTLFRTHADRGARRLVRLHARLLRES
jgi:hypothetical protein